MADPQSKLAERIRKALQDADLLVTTEHDPEPTDFIATELAEYEKAVRELNESAIWIRDELRESRECDDIKQTGYRLRTLERLESAIERVKELLNG